MADSCVHFQFECRTQRLTDELRSIERRVCRMSSEALGRHTELWWRTFAKSLGSLTGSATHDDPRRLETP